MFRTIALAATWSYAALLTYLLLTPDPWQFWGATVGELPEMVHVTMSSYTQHSVAYAMLCALLIWSSSFRGDPSLKSGTVVSCAHAVCTEAVQQFIPKRSGDWWDLLADFAGIVLVASGVWLALTTQCVLSQEAITMESTGTGAPRSSHAR